MPEITYFFAAHSAFAYLGSAAFYEIAQKAGRKIRFRPIDLGKVVAAAHPNGPAKRSREYRNYFFGREIERWGELRGVAFQGGIPANHSHDVTLANCTIIAAGLAGASPAALAHGLLEAHWKNHADLADEAVLAQIITAASLPAAQILQAATGEDVQKSYRQNTESAIAHSVFGSPTYMADGDMFYGQDRLEMLARALDQPFKNSWPKRD